MTSDYDYIWTEKIWSKKVFLDPKKWGKPEFAKRSKMHSPTMTKSAWKIHFQPLHNEVKSILNIKKSYSMKKKLLECSQMFSVRLFGQPGRKIFCFIFWPLPLCVESLWFELMLVVLKNWSLVIGLWSSCCYSGIQRVIVIVDISGFWHLAFTNLPIVEVLVIDLKKTVDFFSPVN